MRTTIDVNFRSLDEVKHDPASGQFMPKTDGTHGVSGFKVKHNKESVAWGAANYSAHSPSGSHLGSYKTIGEAHGANVKRAIENHEKIHPGKPIGKEGFFKVSNPGKTA